MFTIIETSWPAPGFASRRPVWTAFSERAAADYCKRMNEKYRCTRRFHAEPVQREFRR